MVNVPVLEITHYRRDKDSGRIDPNGRLLTDIISAEVRVGIETIKDIFSFKIPNVLQGDGTWNRSITKKVTAENFLKEGDYIEIKAYYNTPDSDEQNNILLVGEITNFDYSNGNDGPVITVNGTNVTENLLRGFSLVGKKVTDVTATPPGIIKEIISRLNQSGVPSAKKVYAFRDDELVSDATVPSDQGGAISNVTGQNGNIASNKSNGDAFPTKTYSKTWQPVYKILEDLSAPEYTGDDDAGNYIFYVKTTKVLDQHVWKLNTSYINELVFQPPSQEVDTVLNRGDDYSTITTKKDLNEVVNVLIVKPGTDVNGAGITTFVVNTESLGEVGPKYDYWAKPEIGNVVRKDERTEGENLGSVFVGDLPEANGSQYPWTFNTIFQRSDNYPYDEDSGTPLVANNESEYNDIIREEIFLRGKIEAQRIVDNLGEARYNSTVSLVTGSNNIGMGTLVDVTDETSGWNDTTANPAYKLRIRDIRHTFDSSGWQTDLVCVEDEKILSEKVNS